MYVLFISYFKKALMSKQNLHCTILFNSALRTLGIQQPTAGSKIIRNETQMIIDKVLSNVNVGASHYIYNKHC